MWNYRIVKLEDEEFYILTQVYYDDNGNPFAWIEEEIGIRSEELCELMPQLEQMKEAFIKPVLHIVDNKLIEKK